MVPSYLTTYTPINSSGLTGTWIPTTASVTSATSNCTWTPIKYGVSTAVSSGDLTVVEVIPDEIPAGKRTLKLPDGSKLVIDDAGNYRIEDGDAKVTYRANRIREFSPHLNASDMLARFVEYVGGLGVKQSELLSLPIELFINWLIIEAAERDGDKIPNQVTPPSADARLLEARKPRCLLCKRYIPKIHHTHKFPFCNPDHGVMWSQRNRPRIPA